MYCENCGRELDNDIKVCPDCGFEVKNNNLQTKNKHKKSENKKISKSIILVIILGAIAAILFIVVDIKNGGSGNDSDGITPKDFISKFDDEYNKQFGTNISFDDWISVSDNQYSYFPKKGDDEYGYWSMQVLCNSETNKVYSVGVIIDESIKVPESWKEKVGDIVVICLKSYASLSQKEAEEKYSECLSLKEREKYNIINDIYLNYFNEGNLLMIQISNFSAIPS